MEHRRRVEEAAAQQRAAARAKHQAAHQAAKAERSAAEAARQIRNQSTNAWTLRGQKHKPGDVEECHQSLYESDMHPWGLGTHIEARFRAQTHGSRLSQWYPGTIASDADAEGRFDVRYHDGDFEAHVPRQYLRAPSPSEAAAASGKRGEARGDDAHVGGEEREMGGEALGARGEEGQASGAVLSLRRRPRRTPRGNLARGNHGDEGDDHDGDEGGDHDGDEGGDEGGDDHDGVGDDDGDEEEEEDIDWDDSSDESYKE